MLDASKQLAQQQIAIGEPYAIYLIEQCLTCGNRAENSAFAEDSAYCVAELIGGDGSLESGSAKVSGQIREVRIRIRTLGGGRRELKTISSNTEFSELSFESLSGREESLSRTFEAQFIDSESFDLGFQRLARQPESCSGALGAADSACGFR